MWPLDKPFYTGVPDKLLVPWLKDKEYIVVTDEGEAVGLAAGYFLATKKRGTVFMSADGFCNALNPLTSYVIPEGIEMNLVISTGRTESPHKEMTRILQPLIKLLKRDGKRLHIKIIKRKP